jgi:replication factor A2
MLTSQQSYQDESLRPVTIKQLLDAEEAYAGADFKVDNATITQVTFVGQVRNINVQPTNVTFKLDDGTGQIDVKKWNDADKQEDADPGFELDSYIRIWGRLRSFSNKRHLHAHVIRPVADFNEVNYHLLEAAYVHLHYTRGPLGQNGAPGVDGDSMFVDAGAGYSNGAGAGASSQSNNKLSGCTPDAKKMYNFMNSTAGGNEGAHLNVISSSVGMSVRDVLQAADELLQHGLIYETVDRETWAILDY